MFIDYYEILGISNSATDEQIKKAYRIKAVKYHPDKHFGDPFFTQKFIEIKNAYDTLIDLEKRKLFDAEYSIHYPKATTEQSQNKFEQTRQEEKKNDEKENEKFRYDPFKPFYSSYDREQQDTPQFAPKKTPWGESAVGLAFFKLPKKIGKIIGGFSTAFEGEKIDTYSKYLIKCFKKSIKSASYAAVISGIMFAIWTSNKVENAGGIAIGLFCIFYIIGLLVTLYKNKNIYLFNHSNYFVGINGFAIYKCEEKIDNIVFDLEVNFNDVTDLAIEEILEFYDNTSSDNSISYKISWFNSKTKVAIHQFKKSFSISKRNPTKSDNYEYHFYEEAEKYWTVYLLDNLENMLSKKGYIEFNLFSYDENIVIPYIKLGAGFITFNTEPEQTYKFNEIKKVYVKEIELFIEHKNFEKIMFFFKTGNRNSVPLIYLANRHFFYKTFELLLGYSIK